MQDGTGIDTNIDHWLLAISYFVIWHISKQKQYNIPATVQSFSSLLFFFCCFFFFFSVEKIVLVVVIKFRASPN